MIDAWVRVALPPTSRSGPAALGHLDGASSLWRGRVDVPGLPVDHVGVGAAARPEPWMTETSRRCVLHVISRLRGPSQLSPTPRDVRASRSERPPPRRPPSPTLGAVLIQGAAIGPRARHGGKTVRRGFTDRASRLPSKTQDHATRHDPVALAHESADHRATACPRRYRGVPLARRHARIALTLARLSHSRPTRPR